MPTNNSESKTEGNDKVIKKDYQQQWEEKNARNRQKKEAVSPDKPFLNFRPMTSEQKRDTTGRYYSETPKSKRISVTPDEFYMIHELREREIFSFDDVTEAVKERVDIELEVLRKKLNEYQAKRETTYQNNLVNERKKFGGTEYDKEIKNLKQIINNQSISVKRLKEELDNCNEYMDQQNRLVKHAEKIMNKNNR